MGTHIFCLFTIFHGFSFPLFWALLLNVNSFWVVIQSQWTDKSNINQSSNGHFISNEHYRLVTGQFDSKLLFALFHCNHCVMFLENQVLFFFFSLFSPSTVAFLSINSNVQVCILFRKVNNRHVFKRTELNLNETTLFTKK